MEDNSARGFLGSVLAVTASLTSLFAILAFGCSVALNVMVFRGWGLDFLQIATPSDVIMSGLYYATRFWKLPLTMVLWIVLTPILYNAMSTTRSGDIARWSEFQRLGWKGTGALLLWIACSVTLATQIYYLTDSRRYYDGTPFSELYVVDAFDAREFCGVKRVLWLGENSVVSQCKSGGISVLKNAENIRLGSLSELEWLDRCAERKANASTSPEPKSTPRPIQRERPGIGSTVAGPSMPLDSSMCTKA